MKLLPSLRLGIDRVEDVLQVWRQRLNELLDRVSDTGFRLGTGQDDVQLLSLTFDPRVSPGRQAPINSLAFRKDQANVLYQKTGPQPTDWTSRTL